VNRNGIIRDNAGNALAGKPCDWASRPLRLSLFHADISQPGLGLGAAERSWLDQHVDMIIHCAAIVRFEANWDDLEAVNIAGTRNVAQLCPSARFIHVSTAYVCGLKDGPAPEGPCDVHGPFGNAYERSKALAEAVVHDLRPAATIVRPSIVIGEAENGRIRSFDTIYRAFKFIAEGKISTVPALPTATLNFVPIDHVVNSIAALVRQPLADGRIIHLVAQEAIPALGFLASIGGVDGLHCPNVVAPAELSAVKGTAAERLARPYWSYFQRHPAFATGELAALTGIAAPALDDAAILRQISFCVEAGFIRVQPN
jgi:nucleoside-diphosphate-sugar epimerase